MIPGRQTPDEAMAQELAAFCERVALDSCDQAAPERVDSNAAVTEPRPSVEHQR